ncbi:hypothetical protein PAECIP111892_05250 [Paenibacillus auburnensis]|uniref:SLH domain-containing protein n=1 Tax=Paenibacillus auburnensis TaxID=2905649 RepID=A0ABM9CUB5_9BACL|nr:S-layer homology domain-containing protein [Paenibacillus auburnensis]CAH1222975.1 hypothetical protein PAECIP111892_05250 [Paenibacillus auburnensis]
MKKNLKARSISILSTVAVLSTLVPQAYAAESFTDISNSYAKDAILELVEKGIINGTGNGKFNPAGNIQRQDFAIILAKTLNLDLSNPPKSPSFTDVPASNYAFSAVEAAVKAGLFKGMGNRMFGNNQNLSREQMAVIFVNALGIDSAGKGQNLKFSDADSIASWAKDAVGAAVELGLMKGNPDGTFNPVNVASRQDVAIVASKFITEKTKIDEQNPTPPVTPTPTATPTPTPTSTPTPTPAPTYTPTQPPEVPQNTIDQAAANQVKSQIAALPAKAEITLANKTAVVKARTDFDALTPTQKTLVGDISKLTDAEVAIVALETQAALDLATANQVKSQIAALPAKAEITLAHKTAVVKARTDFDALTPAQKILVGDISRLTDAEAAIIALETQAALDLAAANLVKDQIAALPVKAEITLANKTAVVKARTDFDALTPAQKTLVGDISRLTDAEATIVALETQAALDLEAANQVKGQIAALPVKAEITLDNKTAVVKARTDFDALTPAQKTLVGDISRLTDAESAIVALETQAALDLAAANQVKSQIAALPAKAEITLANKTAVVKARTDFDALTTAQKTLVGDISRLTDAESAIVALETQAALDLAAANQVKDLIATLPAKAEITLANKTAVVKARTDFDALTPAQKTLVGDISRLTDAETAIVALETQATLDLEAANQVKSQIAALPVKAEITLDNKTVVVKARTDFDALTPAQKTLVGDISRLTDAESAIVALETQAALDLEAANQVKSQIAALPVKAEITLDNKTAVAKARTDFDALTPAQKTLVGDISRLTDAESAIVALEAQAALDLEAASQVKDQIAALPAKAEITLANQTAVVKARMDFNHLTPAQKTLVGDISRLTDAESAIVALEFVATAKENLKVIYNGTDDQVTLPSIQDGAAVTWALKDSMQSSIVDISTGNVTRAGLAADTDVVLIATIISATFSDTKEITIHVQAENNEPQTITSKAITNFDFSVTYATQARKESKKITSTNFQSNPKHFTISDGTITIPVDLTWNIPLNGFTSGQVVGSAIDSFIQDYCNAHGINLGERTLAGIGNNDTFFISTFKTGSDASVTLGGNDWAYFFDNNYFTGTDEDHTKNRTFTVSDGTNTATILLERKYYNMDGLVNALNKQLTSVSATAIKVNETQFKLVANSAAINLTIAGTDKSQFFEN